MLSTTTNYEQWRQRLQIQLLLLLLLLLKKVGSAGLERPINTYQSDDTSSTIPAHKMKKEKMKTAGDKKGACS